MGAVNSDFGMRNSETKLAVDGGLRSVSFFGIRMMIMSKMAVGSC